MACRVVDLEVFFHDFHVMKLRFNVKVWLRYLLSLMCKLCQSMGSLCSPSSMFDKAFQLWFQINFRTHLKPEKLIALINESSCKSSPETGSLSSKRHNSVMRLSRCFKYNRRGILNTFGKKVPLKTARTSHHHQNDL